MLRDSSTVSIWQSLKTAVFPRPDFQNDEDFDVAVIGGGITGITTALLLQKAGKKCILIEARTIGYGTTSGTTAHLNTLIDTPYHTLEKNFGKNSTRLTARAAKEAIALVQDLIDAHRIECDFEYARGYVFSETLKETQELGKMAAAAKRAGIDISYTEENPLPLPFGKCLTFPAQAKFHPMKYLYALATEFIGAGGIISENNRVSGLRDEEGHCTLQTEKGPVRCGKAVYATHIPPGINLLHFYCAPYRSYVLAVQLSDENQYPDGLVYDMKAAYHYFRTGYLNGKPYLIVGGEDHKTGSTSAASSFSNLEAYLRKHFRLSSIAYKWSSQYYVPADGLPYIGRLPGSSGKVFVATGFNGNGMTFGSLSARILTDMIVRGSSPYEELFNPGRIKPVAGFKNFIGENAKVIKHFIADRMTPAKLESLAEIKNGDAMIADYENKKMAVYKSTAGKMNVLDPVCPHAKCLVQWNSAETSWDCPCHGSRFSPEGEVLTGPACTSLQAVCNAQSQRGSNSGNSR